jgi:hypothetical protein
MTARIVWVLGVCLILAQQARAGDETDLTPQQRRERTLASDDVPPPGAEAVRAPAPSEEMLWAGSINPLPNGGWVYVGSLANTVGLFYASTHNVIRSGQIITIWIRWEYRLEQSSAYNLKFRSVVAREEVDCTRQASRDLTQSFYPKNNLDGTATSYSYESQKVLWDPSIPGTVGEFLANWVCSRFKANHQTSTATR